MPLNKKIIVNGKEEKPIKKTKLPRDMDWQDIAKDMQKGKARHEDK